MDRAQRRIEEFRKIKERVRLLIDHTPTWCDRINLPKYIGMLRNNNEVNRMMGGGRRQKTNTRKSCASYRHHGGYGEANHYTARDKRQKSDMDQQEKEFFKTSLR